MSVIQRGQLELSARFDQFPSHLKDKLEARIRSLTTELQARIVAVTPKLTGLLQSEITPNVYDDNPDRIAGYVSVYSRNQDPKKNEYAKAATLEYGSQLPRRLPDHGGVFRKLNKGQKRYESRLTKAPNIAARRYLRDPFAQMEPEIRAALDEVVAQQVAEDNA